MFEMQEKQVADGVVIAGVDAERRYIVRIAKDAPRGKPVWDIVEDVGDGFGLGEKGAEPAVMAEAKLVMWAIECLADEEGYDHYGEERQLIAFSAGEEPGHLNIGYNDDGSGSAVVTDDGDHWTVRTPVRRNYLVDQLRDEEGRNMELRAAQAAMALSVGRALMPDFVDGAMKKPHLYKDTNGDQCASFYRSVNGQWVVKTLRFGANGVTVDDKPGG